MVRVRFIWFDTFQYSQLVRSRITKNFSFPRIRPNLPKFITFSRNMVYELWEKRKFLVLTTPSIQYQSPPAIQKTREIYLLQKSFLAPSPGIIIIPRWFWLQYVLVYQNPSQPAVACFVSHNNSTFVLRIYSNVREKC